MRCISALLLSAVAAASKRPQNPVNLTVYGLRPYNLTTSLDDKDTGDAYGDVFFYLGDRLQEPMACRHDPEWEMCRTQKTLAHDSVYTETVLEVDSSFGNCPGGERYCAKYGACNPTDESGAAPWRCMPKNEYCGKANVTDRYPKPHGHTQWDEWKWQASQLVGGFWYSTQSAGNCDNPDATDCQWRVLEVKKTVNATCSNGNIHKAIEAKNSSCFEACGADRDDITSDCWITCFYTTALGGSVTAEEIVSPWQSAFLSEDAARGGCPSMPPYVPPSH